MHLDSDWVDQQGADAPLLRAIDCDIFDGFVDRVGVAVSGGGDSMALLHLYARWSQKVGIPVHVITINHGLRAEALDEVALVARLCAAHDLSHDVANWDGPSAFGNVQAAAREARYRLIATWAKSRKIGHIVLGHTANDIAETFLMRLGRKSGVDGLAAMPHWFRKHDLQWARPLWQHGRDDLRRYLTRHDQPWADDPSNEDLTQTRPVARRVLAALEPLGISVDAICASAGTLARAKDALASYTVREAERCVSVEQGDVVIDLEIHPPLHPEIKRRLYRAALQFIGHAQYPPRESALRTLDQALLGCAPHTLAGCLVTRQEQRIRFTRELNAAPSSIAWDNRSIDQIWDVRWAISEDFAANTAGELTIRALGEALKDVPDWRETGLPRASLLGTPAVFEGDSLISAPVAGLQNGFKARIVADFVSFLLSR